MTFGSSEPTATPDVSIPILTPWLPSRHPSAQIGQPPGPLHRREIDLAPWSSPAPHPGPYLIFDVDDSLDGSPMDAAIKNKSDQDLKKSQRGLRDVPYRKFGELFARTDTAIRTYARLNGPLGTAYDSFEPLRIQDKLKLPYKERIALVSQGEKHKLVEPVAIWRAESALVAWLTAMLDLSEIPPNQDAIRSREVRQQCISTAQRGVVCLLRSPTPADHHDFAKLYYGQMFGGSYPIFDKPADVDRRLDMAYAHFRTGEAQVKAKQLFVMTFERILANLTDHIRTTLLWPTNDPRPSLTVQAYTGLGAVYAGLALASLGTRKRYLRCQNPECAALIPSWKRNTRRYCDNGGKCAQAAKRAGVAVPRETPPPEQTAQRAIDPT